jgi:hypothetical protein
MSTTTAEPQTEENVATDDQPTDTTPPAPEDALFDKSHYDDPELALPKVDCEGTDKIALKFSGTVFLDRMDPRDVELMRNMKLGNDVTLMIEGKCSKKGWGFTTDREGELDVVKLEHAVTIHSVYKPVS